MAVYAGKLSGVHHDCMHEFSGGLLFCEIEIRLVMAIATFQGVIFLETLPFPLRQVQPMFQKFFPGIDSAGDFSPDFLTGLDLSNNFISPFVRNMAIRTGCPHPRAVAVVDAFHIGGVHIIRHFMASDTKLLRIGNLHSPVESDHVCHSRQEEKHGNNPCSHTATTPHHLPKLNEEVGVFIHLFA
jgi:hypothetical protein